MKKQKSITTEMPPTKMRAVGLVIIISSLLAGLFSLYVITYDLLSIYRDLYKNSPIVETPYMAFGLIPGPFIFIHTLIAGIGCLYTGKKFDPPKNSALDILQIALLKISGRLLIYAVPTAVVITTLLLHANSYSACSKLRISGSGWQVFWVNEPQFCFKPDFFINDNWPCKAVNGGDFCVPADGR